MSDTAPTAGHRSTVQAMPGGVAVSVPARRNLIVLAFLCAWMVGWFVGEYRVVGQLLPSSAIHETAERLSLLYWLCTWTLGGIVGLLMLLWNIGGGERITVQDDALSIRLAMFGVGFTRRHELRFVKNIRVVQKLAGMKALPPASMADAMNRIDGPLAFDYDTKTVQFGGGIDSAKANELLAILNAAMTAPKNS